MSKREVEEVVLAEINLKGCPEGTVLQGNWLPATEVEKKYFRGWQNILWHSPHGRWDVILEDDGREVLDHPIYYDQALVTGDPLWEDYAVEAKIRQMLPITLPFLWMDHDPDTAGRTGLMFRYRDSRHYYFCGIERYDRLVLWRREDRNWVELDWRYVNFDRSRYYGLRIEGKGNGLRGYLEGALVLEANDDVFPTGKAGIRSGCRCRFDEVRVTSTKQAQGAFVGRLRERDRELLELRERYPQPVLDREIDLYGYEYGMLLFGDIRGKGEKDIVLSNRTRRGSAGPGGMRAIGLSGEVLWEIADPVGPAVLKDVDGNGVDEVVTIIGGRVVIVDGVTGMVQAEGDPIELEEGREVANQVLVCNLEGSKFPQDIIVKEGESQLAAFDRSLKLRWRKRGRYSHHVDAFDVDGDGRDEILAGLEMWRGDGTPLWRMEGADYIWTHPDGLAVGVFDEEGPQIAYVVGGEGLIQVDARSGKVRRRHYIGHAQSIGVGNFRPDLPGLEMWVTNWWGSYGIMTLYSGNGEKLFFFEPTHIGGGNQAVNWSGDGEELVYIGCPPKSTIEVAPYGGLYDASGRRVVKFDDEDLPIASARIIDLVGDPRDEIVLTGRGSLLVFTQDRPYEGERIYAPVREHGTEHGPTVSNPGWRIM